VADKDFLALKVMVKLAVSPKKNVVFICTARPRVADRGPSPWGRQVIKRKS
jgi:hypothetical protein